MNLVGDYRYASARLNGEQYAVIRNGDAVERIGLIGAESAPIVWDESIPLTDLAIEFIAASS